MQPALRSVVGMQWNPMNESLYAVVNGIDNYTRSIPVFFFSSWQAAMLPAELFYKK